MRQVTVKKADPVGDQQVPDVHIHVVGGKPFTPIADGRNIVKALQASLPGATMDAVLIQLLEWRRSTLHVTL